MFAKTKLTSIALLLLTQAGYRPFADSVQGEEQSPAAQSAQTTTSPATAASGTAAAPTSGSSQVTATSAPSTPISGPAVAANFVLSPYKDVTINFDYQTNLISTSVTGTRLPLLQGWPNQAVTWVFATGECGSETFGGIPAAQPVGANLAAWTAAKRPYIISTGGAAGAFTCGSDNKFTAFIAPTCRFTCLALILTSRMARPKPPSRRSSPACRRLNKILTSPNYASVLP